MDISKEESRSLVTCKKPNYCPKDQLAFDILAEFAVATSQTITEIMGEEQEEALVKGEWNHAGLASSLNIKNRTGLEGQSLVYAAYATNWAHHIMGLEHKIEITDNGFRWTIKSCPWSRATSALCCRHKYIDQVKVEIFAPGYTISNPKRLSRGNDNCLLIFSKEGVNPDQVISEKCTCEPLPPPMEFEEMVRWNHSYVGSIWVVLVKSLLNELGVEVTINALKSKFKEIGIAFANRFMEEYRISNENPDSLASSMCSFHSSFFKKSRLERTSEGFSIITVECPFSGEPSEVCQLFQYFYDGLLEEVDCRFFMSNSRMMSKGEHACHWVVGKSEKTTTEKSKEEAASYDLIHLLARKLINGEISEDEFERKIALLKKHRII